MTARRLLLVTVVDGAAPVVLDLTPTPAHAAVVGRQIDQITRSMKNDGLDLPEWLKRLRRSFDDSRRQQATDEAVFEGDFVIVPPMARVLTTKDVAERLRIGERSAQRLMPSVPGAFRVGKAWRVSVDDFDRLGTDNSRSESA